MSSDGHIYFVLQYSDDVLHFGENYKECLQFKQEISNRFLVEHTEQASWYLQARITQDADGNVTFDQSRYARAIVESYLPNAPACPNDLELVRYMDPLPKEFKWTIDDKSPNVDATAELEGEFGFRLIEVAGSFNYLSNSTIEEIFALRKMCRHTQMPGRPHFVATLHMLNHFRCYPPNALKFYSDHTISPFSQYLKDAGYPDLDPASLIYSSDSSFQDEDGGRSTGCYIGMFMGGPIDYNSHVPNPIAMSSAEAETNALTVAVMAGSHTRMILNEALFGPDQSGRPYTIPFLIDSQAAFDISKNDKGTKRTRHIERRWLYCRNALQSGQISLHHVDGDEYQLADIGTKNLPAQKMAYKLSILEAPHSETMCHTLKRGVGGISKDTAGTAVDKEVGSDTGVKAANPGPVRQRGNGRSTYPGEASHVSAENVHGIAKKALKDRKPRKF
jgi:hypothetical protein